MKRYQAILAVIAFCVISSTSFAANVKVDSFDYSCMDVNTGVKASVHFANNKFGGVDGRFIRGNFQAVMTGLDRIIIEGNDALYHQETSKSAVFVGIILPEEQAMSVQYGKNLYFCSFEGKSTLVRN